MDEEREPGADEERSEPRRPRVVDKRASTRGAAARNSDQSAVTAQPDTAAPPKPEHAPAPDASQDAPSAADAPPGEETGDGEDNLWTPEREAEARRLAEELARVPARDWVINMAVNLANVAAAKLQRGELEEAQLAIDGFKALLDAGGPRLEEALTPLRQTLAQLQLAYAEAT